MFIGEGRAQCLRMAGPRDDAVGRHAQRLLLHALAAAAQYRPFAGIDEPGEAALEVFVHHVTQRYPRYMLYGSSATTSICTRKPRSTKRCTCTHEVVGNRSLL